MCYLFIRSEPFVFLTPSFFDLLKSDKHTHVPRTNSKEVSCETLVECKWPFVFEDLTNHDNGVSSLARSLVHQASFENVDGRSNNDGVESSSESAERVKRKSFAHAESLCEDLFVSIVRSKLSCVNDRVTHHIGDDSNPKTGKSISSEDLLVAVEGAIVASLS